eukprot:6436548-Prymnesium_polylepis.1
MIISVLAAMRLPESPRWLVARGRHSEAAAVLTRALRSAPLRRAPAEHRRCAEQAGGSAEE